MGGDPTGARDRLSNVAMLCKRSHDVLDSRLSWGQSRYAITTLFAAYVQAKRSQLANRDATELATDTSSSAGKQVSEPTLTLLNTESLTDESQQQNTYTTSITARLITGPATLKDSPQKNTEKNTVESIGSMLGDSTNKVAQLSKSVTNSDAAQAKFRVDCGNEGTHLEIPVLPDVLSLTPDELLNCFWPGCHLAASVNSSVSVIHQLGESSKMRGYHLDSQVALCDQHRKVLTNDVAVGRGDAVKRLLAAYLGRC